MILRRPILILCLLACSMAATGRSYVQKAGRLEFSIDGNAGKAAYVIDGKVSDAIVGAEFWRLILDDGKKKEIPVLSQMQTGKVRREAGALIIEYDSLLSEYGDRYPVRFTIKIETVDGLLRFSPTIENNDAVVRVNECFCPMADFSSLGGKKEEDILYWPQGPGARYTNPWKLMEDKSPAYYSHDERETFMDLIYPRASMSWFGVESGNKFLYVARYDKDMRYCFLSVRHRIHEDNLTFAIDHFPMALPGEKLEMPQSVVGVLDGDWRDGAATYRRWADAGFFKVPQIYPWIKNLTGFQRIIMRSQYGEDYYTPKDLPEMYKAGAKYGIHTLFLFAWWKAGMDRGYPYYEEAYPGAFKDLAEGIKKVQEMGGHVILECNCHFLDPQVDYYEKFGKDVQILDINGDPLAKYFVYNGRGELREKFGHKLFYLACSGTQRWRDQLMGQIRLLDSFGADCLFADCFGFCPYQPCFNTAHEHGPRVDKEWIYHRMFFSDAMDYSYRNGKVFATEGVTDIAGTYCQFMHGNIAADFKIKTDDYPQMFAYTFPELIFTERNIYSSDGRFDRQLRNALTMGARLDAQLWVCRADISKDPKYAAMIGWYTSKLNEYGEFFFDGKFTVIDRSPLPYYIKRTEWLSADGKKVMRVLYNATDKTTSKYCNVTLGPDEVRFDIFDAQSYCK